MSETEKDIILTITAEDGMVSMHTANSVAGAFFIITQKLGGDKKSIRTAVREGKIRLYSRAGSLERRITARVL